MTNGGIKILLKIYCSIHLIKKKKKKKNIKNTRTPKNRNPDFKHKNIGTKKPKLVDPNQPFKLPS